MARLPHTEHEGPAIDAVMANNPPLAEARRRYAEALNRESGIDPEMRELIALRIAILHHAEYAWQYHVALARALSISDERITALEHWHSSEHVPFRAEERAVLGYTDAMVHGHHPRQAIHDVLARYYSASEIVGINLLIGYFRMEADFAAALDIETEEKFVGWELF